jgi:hypothetical protein
MFMCIFRLGSDVGSEHVCVVRCVRNTFIGGLQKFMSWIFSRERTVHLFYFTLLFMSISKVYKISRVVRLVEVLTCILKVFGSSIRLFTDFCCYYSARGSWSPFQSRTKVKMSVSIVILLYMLPWSAQGFYVESAENTYRFRREEISETT